ncbi:hypothetical protein A3I40_03260 [Candidatus Uhrbacteria bacterium RIFCSPLOWO2_02_FULL_48_12]|uniref:HTH HARE-type domain-containing protein n=1 Tax=Candidatus Uhrbacteria bacterium RIFCSPLOWO2_02_FULL_48_12 TaxID=1802407 RepID=A0A1F7V6F0_9BACT|nr:MAG: hypothetical protein A3I40_03260 [Candidatus Uhrbacteria bacterium RIFCSPLOWO2_02_FULL_48_12]
MTYFCFYAILELIIIALKSSNKTVKFMAANAILDKILTQRHADEIRAFNPITVVDDLMRGISDRERVVIIERFRLSEKGTEATLEEIGDRFKITRERVRQLIKVVIIKLRELQTGHDEIQRFTRIAEQLLQSFGGVLEERFFISELLDLSEAPKDEPSHHRAVAYLEFLLNETVVEAIEHRPANNTRRAVYAIPGIDDRLLVSAINEFVSIVDSAKTPLSEEELIKEFKKLPLYSEKKSILVDEPVRLAREFFKTGVSVSVPPSPKEESEVLRAYIAAAAQLEQNIFGEWGRKEWPTIHPKRMNDKIYLVLKHEGKPLHFVSIADKVNTAHFDHKVAKSPSVHNELILDKRFVLVGRGIYALKEWGFSRGTVTEVIKDILKGPDGLTREEVVEEVLKRRFVKKQTIHLALMNRAQFTKQNNGRYILAAQ